MKDFGESKDELVAEVVDLIEHEPKRGGLLGFGERDWANYQKDLNKALEALERSAAQQGVPADRTRPAGESGG